MKKLTLTIEPDVMAKLTPKLTANKRLLLTFEDGVGQYSQHAAYHMQTQFTINIIAADAPLDGYGVRIDSNLGPVAVKDYSVADLQQTMTLRLNTHQNTIQLMGEGGLIDDNVGLIDFTDPEGIKKNPAQ